MAALSHHGSAPAAGFFPWSMAPRRPLANPGLATQPYRTVKLGRRSLDRGTRVLSSWPMKPGTLLAVKPRRCPPRQGPAVTLPGTQGMRRAANAAVLAIFRVMALFLFWRRVLTSLAVEAALQETQPASARVRRTRKPVFSRSATAAQSKKFANQFDTLPGPSGRIGLAPRPSRPRVPERSNRARSQREGAVCGSGVVTAP